MKTFKKTIETESKRLVIQYDESPESPREWSNLGYFVQKTSRHISPDGKDNDFYRVMVETGDIAKNTQNHMELMKEELEKLEHKVKYIFPVSIHEHSAISYALGERFGFDYSNNAFYIVLENEETKAMTEEGIKGYIDRELETYTAWANGEVYCFTLYDEKGELEESCCGFYDLEAIKQNLPKEWKDENMEDYLID